MTDTPPSAVRGAFYCIGVIFRAGWRPTAGWVAALILFVNGVILPLARLYGFRSEPIDWRAMAVFVGALIGLAGMRSYDKNAGSEDNDHG